MNLSGKKSLVTGAARGIGRGCALELARAGADVVINDLRRSDLAESAAAEIRALGRHSDIVEGDVFTRGGCEQVFARALESLGRIDILVSNPARNMRALVLEYDPQAFEQVIQATLIGGFHMGQLAARHMAKRGGGGKIIFISSVHTWISFARNVAYNAAKAGLNHMAFTMANELTRHRINVNVIEPGWIDTPGEHETFGSAALAEAGAQLPWGRLGTPADIGKAAVFLASDDADYVTGTALLVDGGIRFRGATE